MPARRAYALPTAKAHYAPDRPANIGHIALKLSFDFERKILYGRCATTFTVVGAGLKDLEMDAGGLTIKAVTSAGKPLQHEASAGKLLIRFSKPIASGRTFDVVVDYEARRPRQGIYFIGPDEGYPKKPVHVWTQGQDQDAHYWFPCIDHPNDKATSEVTATVPEAFFVLSNGVLVETLHDKKKKTKTYHWKMDVPHVTYLISVVAGRFTGRTSSADGTPVSWYVHPGREVEGARSFGKTPRMIEFFNDRIGVRYPYAKYAQIAVSDFIFGGMENTTATTQTDATLHDARAALNYTSDHLVAHELAHQWFGDYLTCKDWSHAWLNEGFATYFDALFTEADRGADDFAYYRIEQQDRYLREDRDRYRRPIVTNVYSQPVDLFDRHLYEKGACVLHMIRRRLGDDLWWRAINRYVADNARRHVETVDFARALETVSGRNFQPMLDQWVFGSGHPEFEVHYHWDAQGRAAIVRVKQTQSEPFSVPLSIDFGFAGGRREAFDVTCDAAEQSFRFPLRAKPDTFAFDGEADVLKTLKLNVPREMLLRQLASDRRIGAGVAAARALAEGSSSESVEGLARAVMHARHWSIAVEAATALGRIRSEAALEALLRSTKVPHAKVRRAVADALGSFRGDQACRALMPLLKHDRSYAVEAAAATSIGKTRSTLAFAALVAGLEKESWTDEVRSGVMAGFAELGDDRAVPLLLAWIKYGRPPNARRAAAAALGRLGEGRKDVSRALIELLDDERDVRMRLAAVEALEAAHDRDALPELDRIAGHDVDGRLKSRCIEAAHAIRTSYERSDQVKQLRDDLEQLRETNKRLQDRLDRLESGAHGDGIRQRPRRNARS